ncbi:MAG: response regulator transcription factor [Chloroflexi bacterium]|nr:response regulator transcription factor [Chloroflexota bacterium]
MATERGGRSGGESRSGEARPRAGGGELTVPARGEQPRILIVEDEQSIAQVVGRGLARAGYAVRTAGSAQAGTRLALEWLPDLLILDLWLPDDDGLNVCRALRQSALGRTLRIIMLTARDAVRDRVIGLESGADDYLTKPFALEELVARVRVQLRRHQDDDRPLTYGSLTLNPRTREVFQEDRPVSLTPREYDVLELFVRHPRQVLSRQFISEQAWGYDYEAESNVIDVFIRRLRRKLETEGEEPLIHTVRRVGYALR